MVMMMMVRRGCWGVSLTKFLVITLDSLSSSFFFFLPAGHLERSQNKRQKLQEAIGKLQSLLREETKREILLRITHENLNLVKNDVNADYFQLGTLNQLEQELRRKILSQNMNQTGENKI
eukprot:TRINITY_DN2313_c0_g1_i2.p2 TRINITY_DN2313_c0_g1~~TRINITY_DN2313_c0_g1_i2.p2  ORF type:complete len:120 (-),score=37.74 TRINITY_DN2313_c0_g1_i2:301-660(-)